LIDLGETLAEDGKPGSSTLVEFSMESLQWLQLILLKMHVSHRVYDKNVILATSASPSFANHDIRT